MKNRVFPSLHYIVLSSKSSDYYRNNITITISFELWINAHSKPIHLTYPYQYLEHI